MFHLHSAQNKTHIKAQRVAATLLADLLSRRLRSAGALICYSATNTWWHCGIMALEGEAGDWGWRRSHHLTLAGSPTAALPSLTSGDFERSERCRVNQQLHSCTSLPDPESLESLVVAAPTLVVRVSSHCNSVSSVLYMMLYLNPTWI